MCDHAPHYHSKLCPVPHIACYRPTHPYESLPLIVHEEEIYQEKWEEEDSNEVDVVDMNEYNDDIVAGRDYDYARADT
jgi:hypothetical protein